MLFRPLLLLLSLCLGSISFCSAQAAFSLEDILSSPFPTQLTTHPPSQQVAWVFNTKGVRNIWVAQGTTGPSKPVTSFTKDDGQDIGNLQFTPTGTHLVYTRGGSGNRQGEKPNPVQYATSPKQETWLLSLEDGSSKKLFEGGTYAMHPSLALIAYTAGKSIHLIRLNGQEEGEKLLTMRGAPSNLSWSPHTDTPRLAFVSNRGDHSFIGTFELGADRISYISPSVDQDRWPVWSPSGEHLAFMRFPYSKPQIFVPQREAQPWSIGVTHVETGKTKIIWTADTGMGSAFRTISAPNQLFWGKGDRLIFPWEKSGWTHLYSLSAEGGSPVSLTPGDFEVQYVSLSHDKKDILYSSNQGDIDRQHIWQVSVTGGKAKRLSTGEQIEWAPQSLGSDQPVVCLSSSATTPAYPAYIDEDGALHSLTEASTGPDFPTGKLVQPQQVIFPASDGMDIHGQLFLPPNVSSSHEHPAVLFFHGGSRRQMFLGFHHRGYYHNAYALNQYLASQGYVVLSVNYRSGIGYGMKFREAMNYGAGGASEFLDVLGAGLFLKSHPAVHPDKIGLWGGSYGGYLTALGLARASDLFAAGVDIHGVHDWNPVIQNFIPSYNPLEDPEFTRLAFESSPLAHMDGWRSPVLLIHGDDDRNVPFSESVDLVRELRKREIYFEQLIFPDEVHGFLLHSNWVKAYQATADFFDRKLK